jgi:tRNA (cmo5U34)-methyltransferase
MPETTTTDGTDPVSEAIADAIHARVVREAADADPGELGEPPLRPDGKGYAATGYAPAEWTFDEEVTRVFDDMLERSIPQYATMRSLVTDLAIRYARPGGHVVDLGCSRGEAIAPLLDRLGARNRFLGLEISEPMLAAARERFAAWIDAGVVRIDAHDLRTGYPSVAADVTLAVLTLQFTPIEHRQRILRDVYRATAPGGALILVEKVLGSTAELDATLVDLYWKLKRAAGYSDEDIRRKALALEGKLVPVTARWNEELLRMAGFQEVDCVWRWCNFAAWLAVRS